MSNKNPKGFGGLSQLYSKSETQADPVESNFQSEIPTDTIPPTLSEAQSVSERDNTVDVGSESEVTDGTLQDDHQEGNKLGGSWRYIFGFLLIAGIFLVISQDNDSPSSVPESAKSSSLDNSTAKTPTASQLGSPSVVGKTNQPRNETPELQYNKPPVGSNNILSLSQIRWCTREIMRIDAMRTIFDTNEGIDEFNRIVNDYNSRCSDYRYRKGNLSRAEREVEKLRAIIVSQATREAELINQRFKKTSNVDSPSSLPEPAKSSSLDNSAAKTPTASQLGSPSVVGKTNQPRNETPELQYNKPPIGSNNILSLSQIRWCTREIMRIDAMRNIFDTNGGIGEFNRIVNDYNSRCSDYRYRQGDLSIAEREVETHKSTIITEATREAKLIDQRFKKNTNVSKGTSSKPPANLTREVQQLLTNLGYKPGPIDGDYGRGTANAIMRFQNDHGINTDGKIDKALIAQLQRASKSVLAEQVSGANRQPAMKSNDELDLSSFSRSDRVGIEEACRYRGSPAKVNKCQKDEVNKLRQSGGAPDLAQLSHIDREGIESACRYRGSPANIYNCQKAEVNKLKQSGGAPDLSRLSRVDREGIESACRYRGSPANIYSCQKAEVNKLKQSGGAPDLSRLSRVDREGIESACRYRGSPANIYSCQKAEVNKLRQSGGAPDLSQLSHADREGIKSACRYRGSPANVYNCQRRELSRL